MSLFGVICTRCGKRRTKGSYEGQPTCDDRCPTCRGFWLDAGELEQIRDTIEDGLTTALVQGMVIPG